MLQRGHLVECNDRWINGPTGKRKQRLGVVVSISKDPEFVWVLWEGCKFKQRWATDFLQLATRKTDAQ